MNGDIHKVGQISPRKSTVKKELSSGVLSDQSFFLWNSFHFVQLLKLEEGRRKCAYNRLLT